MVCGTASQLTQGVAENRMADHDDHYQAVAKVYSLAVFYDSSGPFVKWLQCQIAEVLKYVWVCARLSVPLESIHHCCVRTARTPAVRLRPLPLHPPSPFFEKYGSAVQQCRGRAEPDRRAGRLCVPTALPGACVFRAWSVCVRRASLVDDTNTHKHVSFLFYRSLEGVGPHPHTRARACPGGCGVPVLESQSVFARSKKEKDRSKS